MTQARATVAKLTLLTSLYFCQGLPYGFLMIAIPVTMRQQGEPLWLISLTSLLSLPWVFRVLWAPAVDRKSGGSLGPLRSWIIPLQLGSIAMALAMSLLDPATDLVWVLACHLGMTCFSATQDTATDSLAIRILPPEQRGLGNGFQVAGHKVGVLAGGGASSPSSIISTGQLRCW